MKSIIKISLLMIALLSTILISGCGKSDFTGIWIGFNDDQIMYTLTIEKNGDAYLVTRDSYSYKLENEYPEPEHKGFLEPNTRPNVTYDFPFILVKDTTFWNTTLQLSEGKDILIASKDVGDNIHIIDKDNTILFKGILYQKEPDQTAINNILKQMQSTIHKSLVKKYYKFGDRALEDRYEKVTIGNVTFDDSILTTK